MINKPLIIDHTWANASENDPELIERPPQTKINEGWLWGEKPSHKWFNYGWKVIDDYTHHINSFGVPYWDGVTLYELGSVVLYSPYIYQATTQNSGSEPEEGNNPDWEIIGQFLKNLDDTWDDISSPIPDDGQKRLLVYDSGTSKWIPELLDDITSQIKVENLIDTTLRGTINTDDILAYAGKEDERYWTNMSINEAISRDEVSTFTLADKIQYKNPNPNDVLKYDGNIWKIEPNIMNKTQWYKVLNPPAEFIPPYAQRDVLGGAKIYSYGQTLYIVTEPQGIPGAPIDVDTFSDPVYIDIFWIAPTQGERASYYKVYRDSQEIQTGILDNIYTDEEVERDREYIYYVTAINKFGESTESNKVVGQTFSEPSKPQNLNYKIYVNTIQLIWETPEIVSGNLTYKIFRNGVEIGETMETSYEDENVAVGSYTYFITANNKYFNSENSNTVIVIKQ